MKISMPKILCIGEALIDMICVDKGSSLVDGEQFVKKPGGAPTNVAAAIGALGGQVELLAKVGYDPFGTLLIKILNDFNVSTRYVFRDPVHFTTMAFVSLMEDGERDFVFSRGADGFLSKKDIGEVQLSEYDIIHFGSATAFLPGALREAYDSLLISARRTGKFISFDPNYRHLLFKDNISGFVEDSWRYIEVADFFKLSDEEAFLITDKSTIDEAVATLRSRTKAIFAITLGAQGTLLHWGTSSSIVPSIKINQVDSTGAGDAFVGAVLYQLSTENPQLIKSLTETKWLNIIEKANIAGARTCEHLGAMEAFKQLNNSIFMDS
jgi:fructokinase